MEIKNALVTLPVVELKVSYLPWKLIEIGGEKAKLSCVILDILVSTKVVTMLGSILYKYQPIRTRECHSSILRKQSVPEQLLLFVQLLNILTEKLMMFQRLPKFAKAMEFHFMLTLQLAVIFYLLYKCKEGTTTNLGISESMVSPVSMLIFTSMVTVQKEVQFLFSEMPA